VQTDLLDFRAKLNASDYGLYLSSHEFAHVRRKISAESTVIIKS